jgi:peptidylprolyl isomerase
MAAMTRRTVPGALLALSLLLPLAACGDDSDSTNGSSEVSTDLGTAPKIPASAEDDPTELVIEDVVVGDGAEAEAGDVVEVKYVGGFPGTGEEFDSSWSGGESNTFQVQLGAGSVIEGFDRGITGMKEGGRRMVTMPSELGYGSQVNGPIPADSTLTFIIDLVEVA